MDERLDHLLAAAAPPVSYPTNRVVVLERIVAEAQVTAATKRLQIGRRICLTALTFLAAVGAGVGVAEASHMLLPENAAVYPSDQANFPLVSGPGAK